MSERINLVVNDGVGERMTALAGGERARGAWLSKLVVAMHENGQRIEGDPALDELRLMFTGLVAESRMTAARVAKLEAQLAAMIAGR